MESPMSSRCESRLTFDTRASSFLPDRDVAGRPVPAKLPQVVVPAWDALRLCKESGEAFDRSGMGGGLFLFQFQLPVLRGEGPLDVDPLVKSFLVQPINRRWPVPFSATTR